MAMGVWANAQAVRKRLTNRTIGFSGFFINCFIYMVRKKTYGLAHPVKEREQVCKGKCAKGSEEGEQFKNTA
jgi:hypothetical protein